MLKKKENQIFVVIALIILGFIVYKLYLRFNPGTTPPLMLPPPQITYIPTPESDLEVVNPIEITLGEIQKGWYWGSSEQKKTGTPDNWIFTEAGRSSCWHEPALACQE